MSEPLSKPELASALNALQSGAVIACPTEAVWGLSADPGSEPAVQQILDLKQRPVEKGLILVAAAEAQLEFLLSDLAPEQRALLHASWPGPNTWLVPHGGRVPSWVCGSHATVAVRVSDHPGVAQLCDAFGGPLVSTSANPAGADPAMNAAQVRAYFGDSAVHIVPGELGGSGRPSQIRDLAGNIIRA